jgi:hypothetical protein
LTRYGLFSAILLVVAILVTAGAYADTKPARVMEFHVQESSLSDVMEILTRYAQREGLTVENIGPRLPPRSNRTVFYINLTRQGFAEITATNLIKQDQMLLGFYYPKQAANSEQIGDALVSELREKWPDIHVYTGP